MPNPGFTPVPKRKPTRGAAPTFITLYVAALTCSYAFAEDDAEHWSTKRLVRPEPATVQSDWIRNDVDRFITAAQQERGLTPSPEADRRTLIRRLTYDLHGLPPTPEEVQAFVDDNRPDAYEQLVDRLLDSPRYGERWARHWLDIAHYGETHGFDKDQRRDNAWPYRDYVIRAFNEDKSYSRFVQEQIAGDLLWPDEPEGIIASGFLAAGPWDLVGQVEVREGTVEKKRVRNLDRDDIVTSVFNTFMSTTVQCARCHDHKFDPIAQTDYYNLQAIFADIDRGDRAYEPADRAQLRRKYRTQRAEAQKKRDELQARIEKHLPDWFAKGEEEINVWRGELKNLDKGSSPSNGYHSVVADTPKQTEWVQVDLGEETALDRIVLVPARPTDYKDTPGFGFPIRFDVAIAKDESFNDAHIVLDARESDYVNPGDNAVTIPLDGKSARYVRVTAYTLWERNQDYAFALAEMEVYANGKEIAHDRPVTARSSIEFGRWGAKRLIDGYSSRARLHGDDKETAERRAELEKKIAEARSKLAEAEGESVPAALLNDRKALDTEIQRFAKLESKLPKPDYVYAVKPVTPRPIFALNRGNVTEPLEPSTPAALRHVTGMDCALRSDESRAALAEWVTDPKNGLTWRSIVNRVWQFHFGQGLVTTPNDFGWAGAEPTHPDLLDWLAVEFRDSGGSFRHLHRVILNSAAYRQQCAPSRTSAAIDGQNQYVWRMNRTKLDAESVRDAILSVSGTLDLAMGGPSVELFNYTHDHSPKYDYVATDDPSKFRRSIYRYIVRSVPDPLFEAFDCADPNISTPKRHETLTAQQALTLSNDTFVLQQSEHFAERLRALSEDPRQNVRDAFELALARPPSEEELNALTEYTSAHGVANLARLVFNLNEFIFVD